MGLEVETAGRGASSASRWPTTSASTGRRLGGDGCRRTASRLNAMTTPQLIAWLDQKMADHGDGKLIPPDDVLEQELGDLIERKVRAALTERILREAKLDEQVAAAVAKMKLPDGERLARDIAKLFKRTPDSEWRDHIEAVASDRAQEEDRNVIRE